MRQLWTEALWAGAGGFLGSALRFLIVAWTQRSPRFVAFPLGTLVVNAAGSFLLGLLMGGIVAREMLGPSARVFLVIGVLGGFTTFSTFAYETVALARDGAPATAVINVALQVGVGLVAAVLGFAIGRAT